MALSAKNPSSKKEKVTISLDADLLYLVDTFVEKTKDAGISRSSVVEEGLRLWKQAVRESYDAIYYAANSKSLDDPAWTAITTEAAKHLWAEE
jgi:hypothetical protein